MSFQGLWKLNILCSIAFLLTFSLSLFYHLLFLSLSSSFSSSLFSCFTHTVHTRAHSGIPHRRNNYYYESDPGQETTIASSFLLPLPSLPALVPRGPHAEFVRLVLFSPSRVSSYLQLADGTLDRDTQWFTRTTVPRCVIITAKVGETPLEYWMPRNNSFQDVNHLTCHVGENAREHKESIAKFF